MKFLALSHVTAHVMSRCNKMHVAKQFTSRRDKYLTFQRLKSQLFTRGVCEAQLHSTVCGSRKLMQVAVWFVTLYTMS